MITIYAKSWDANRATFRTPQVTGAASYLRSKGLAVTVNSEQECPSQNCGFECDTDAELDAIQELSGKCAHGLEWGQPCEECSSQRVQEWIETGRDPRY